ncbi:MAG: class I SAM-dependent methyltransferase [Clostridiales bacterium]|nr:class I SAM-dependent methyltransferase [Clostridiales bacterium]
MELEKMASFFEKRLDGYEEHMLNGEEAKEFYPFTAAQLPAEENCRVLDLGCGTGLELDEYFKRNPSAKITGIDLSAGMLDKLRKKYPNKNLTLINASYFEKPLGNAVFDAAVSVESLHHFTKEQKEKLYKKLHGSLKEKGFFILTDYFSEDETEEKGFFETLAQLKQKQGILDEEFYHYDTPLTPEHEIEALRAGGFSKVEILGRWKSTVMMKAYR